MSAPEIDHSALALARRAQFLKDKPNFEAILGALTTQAQELETAFQALMNDRLLDNATGASLDVIGAIVRQPRNTLDDELYRLRIKARIRTNLSSGTIEDIYSVFVLIVPEDATLEIEPRYPAGFELHINGAAITPAEAVEFARFLGQARAAGVRGLLVWSEAAPEDTFTMDGVDGQGFDEGAFAGAAE